MLDQENLISKKSYVLKQLLRNLQTPPATQIATYQDLLRPGFYADGIAVVENTSHEEAYRQEVAADQLDGDWVHTVPSDKGYQVVYEFANSTIAFLFLTKLGIEPNFIDENLEFIETDAKISAVTKLSKG